MGVQFGLQRASGGAIRFLLISAEELVFAFDRAEKDASVGSMLLAGGADSFLFRWYCCL